MIARKITPMLLQQARYFPVVTILGPRQSGKTTLARNTFPRYAYVNLEDLTARDIARNDPKTFFEIYPPPVIIDEVQRVPELLSTIQIMADAVEENGRFILTGSHQPRLQEGISQSLAGRTGILKLLPLSIEELSAAGIILTRDEYIFNGFLPRLHRDKTPPALLYSAYYQTYVERDVRLLINVANQNSFDTFIRLLAGRVGQVVNLNSLAGDVGVSSTTLASWLSVVEASYIISRLPCYFNNFGTRLVKAPKIFFTDVGLVAWLLNIESASQVIRDPLLGGLFENLVIVEALKARYNAGKQSELYYFSVQQQFEVDLILNEGRVLTPIEIKAGMTYNSSFADNLHAFQSLTSQCVNPTVIYSGDLAATIKGVAFKNFRDTAQIIVGAH